MSRWLNFLADYFALVWSGLGGVLGKGRRKRGARLLFLCLFVCVYPGLMLFLHTMLFLDRLFFPGLSKVKIEKPLFIVGGHRTGSTFVHRTLSKHEHFATFRLLDIFLPSLLLKKFVKGVGRIDGVLGGHLRRLLHAMDDRLLPNYSRIHDTRIMAAEEDEFIGLVYFCSSALWELFPDVERFRRFVWVDRDMDRDEQDLIMERYRGLMARQIYHCGQNKRFIAKNPLYTPRIATLARTFPDARFIYLTRTPLRMVPSAASLMHFVWHNTGALSLDDSDPVSIMDMCDGFYDDALRVLDPLVAEGRASVVRYDDLMKEPIATLEASFEAMGLPFDEALREVLDQANQARRGFKPKHSYSVDQYGLDEETIRARYASIFERFDYV